MVHPIVVLSKDTHTHIKYHTCSDPIGYIHVYMELCESKVDFDSVNDCISDI